MIWQKKFYSPVHLASFAVWFYYVIWILVSSEIDRNKETFSAKGLCLILALIGSFIWHHSHFMSIKLTIHMCVVFNNNITEDLHCKSRYIDAACEQCNYREKSSEKRCLTILYCLPGAWIRTINAPTDLVLVLNFATCSWGRASKGNENQGNGLSHVLISHFWPWIPDCTSSGCIPEMMICPHNIKKCWALMLNARKMNYCPNTLTFISAN